MTGEALSLALLIFILRVVNYAVGTMRLVVITRDQRLLAALLAALEALIFAVVIAGVINDLENVPNLVAYCAGAAVGSYMGMVLEARLVRSYMIINVFANVSGGEIAEALRSAGFGVTSTTGEGRTGAVTTLRSVIDKRDVKRMVSIIQSINPQAFIAAEEARGVSRGWLGVGKGKGV